MKFKILPAAAAILAGLSAFAAEAVDKALPPAPFQKVGALVKLPDFPAGIGELYCRSGDAAGATIPRYDIGRRRVVTQDGPTGEL
jgi:hypothetical protein